MSECVCERSVVLVNVVNAYISAIAFVRVSVPVSMRVRMRLYVHILVCDIAE